MLSTSDLSTRETTDADIGSDVSDDEYNESDRQRMAAETDAAIADVRAMPPSAFATGHLPAVVDDEVTPDSDHRRKTAGSTDSRITFESKCTTPPEAEKEAKLKKNMGNKALIVSYSWGSSIKGGVTDSVHLLSRLLRALGMSVYCTTLRATEEEMKEARGYGVELIPPSPIRKFKVRGETPDADWLYRHKNYFSDLKDLANVRFVFGIGMVTSEAAFEIERDVFPRAAFYLINLYDSDLITPVIADCVHSELEFRREELLKEGQDANSVFSVGGSVFRKYKKLYRSADKKIKHDRLSPMVDEENFKLPSPEPLDEDENFQILSLFQEHELGNLKSDSVIVKAMNSVADLFYNHRRSPPTWKILGVPKRCESDLLNRLNLHSKLDVVLARMPSDKRLKHELCQCHLVLVPPSSDHYVNLTLASMCAAVPIIIPWRSQSHELIQRHLRRHEIWLVVDMSEAEPLREGIMRYLCNYKVALKKAKDIRNDVRNQVRQELESINDTFFEVVKEDAEVIHGLILQRQKTLEEKHHDNEDDKENQGTAKESSKSSRKRKWQGRDPGVMKVKVQVSEVVPESGRTVEEVERGFYESQEVKEKTEEVGQMLDGQHDEMKVKDIGHESISYTMACQSLDALECLIRKYENGKIQDLMEDEFLSDELLDKIGAYYLAIDVTIDYEEYLMCRKELIQMYGEPVNDGQQERDIQSMGESHESETSQEKIDGSARRVNRARYLLKSFEKEGGKVTENQINMLDQLLKEKEEKRQLVHKRSLQASGVEEILHGVHGEHIQRGSSGILRPHDSELSQATNLHQLTEDQITDLNEGLKSEIAKQTHDGRVARAMHRERGRGRDILRSSLVEGKKVTEREFNPLFSEFIQVKTDMRELETNRPEATIKNEKLLAEVEAVVQDADIDEEMKELYIEKRRIDKGIPVQNTVRKISRYGNGPGEVCRPWALVINKNGEVVVCDKGPDEGPVDQPGSVKTIAPDTAQVLSIITFHCLPETFRPTGVAIDDQGVYYIADDGNQCIVVCDALGKLEQTIDLGEVSSPEICLGQGNDIFVADYNGHVMKYNKAGQKKATRELTSPWSPTMNNKNQLLVSGSSDGCVYVLDDDLNILYTFGEEELTEPMGLGVDAMGENVYVANYTSVAIFSAQGEHLKYVKVEGIPEKLAVFADGRIVYVDSSDSNDLCLKVI